jgi:hypothetical protein
MVWCLQCANSPTAAGFSAQDPIFPRTSSILPLAKNNAWLYSFTAFDSLGRKINPSRLDYHISIDEQFGIVNATTIVKLDRSNYNVKYSEYAYQYVHEGRTDRTYLVVYHELYPLAVRGLYIIGECDTNVVQLYPAEQFWLAYPADSGKTWTFKTDPLSIDTTKKGIPINTLEDTMVVLSTNARFYTLDATTMSGLAAYDSCYLYKQSNGVSVSYYYYNKNAGCLGYQQYVNGTIRDTYILKSIITN